MIPCAAGGVSHLSYQAFVQIVGDQPQNVTKLSKCLIDT